MPIVVKRRHDEIAVATAFEWSWPDHPKVMTDTEARIRVGRAAVEISPASQYARINEDELVTAYGKLLAQGEARIQQVTTHGDNLPRRPGGALLGIKQEMATDVTEHANGWPPDVYDTGRDIVKHTENPVPEAWGATNREGTATWVPRSDGAEDKTIAALLASRALDGATDSRRAADIAWCANLPLSDDGAIWREAVARGRSTKGAHSALDTCCAHAREELEIHSDRYAREYSVKDADNKKIVLNAPIRNDSPEQESADRLYAVARGSLCTEYGPPLTKDEKALDALTASIITSRGTNGAGIGWNPPEPELLKDAGRVLVQNPERLQDVVEHVQDIEKQLYPRWPGRTLELEEPSLEEERTATPDVFDRERERHQFEVQTWREAHERTAQPQRDGHRAPQYERPRTGGSQPERPGYTPGRQQAEIPLPAHAPDGNRQAPARTSPGLQVGR